MQRLINNLKSSVAEDEKVRINRKKRRTIVQQQRQPNNVLHLAIFLYALNSPVGGEHILYDNDIFWLKSTW
jgi:hypothetical protein